jgi:hypothetical protein
MCFRAGKKRLLEPLVAPSVASGSLLVACGDTLLESHAVLVLLVVHLLWAVGDVRHSFRIPPLDGSHQLVELTDLLFCIWEKSAQTG